MARAAVAAPPRMRPYAGPFLSPLRYGGLRNHETLTPRSTRSSSFSVVLADDDAARVRRYFERGMALLSLRGAAKSFGSRLILDGLDFDVEPGARVGVIGPNGGGKSTMLRILCGLETADAGELTQRRGLVVAFLPQQPEG